jgi:general secretion pathway protein A
MMLLEYYGLNDQPFGVTPDPRYLYFSEGHREALAAIYYAIDERRGFSALVAKPGMGKTTLLFRLLESLQESARTAFLFQVGQDSRDFLDSLVRDLGIRAKSTNLPALHDALNAMLVKEMEQDRRVVVVIDEAQNLTEQMLEQVRLLSNFETPAAKMMHIVLAGQPGLGDKLANPSLTQLRQRVGAVAQLPAFTLKETTDYIGHRLSSAGCADKQLFTSNAVENIATASEGIPRNINSICFQALALGFVYQKPQIGTEIVAEVLRDLELKKEAHQATSRATANSKAPQSQAPQSQRGAPSTFRQPATTWPAFPAAAQAVDFGYYGMPHASERRAVGSGLGMAAFLLVFLPLLTFAVLTKTGVVDGHRFLDRLVRTANHSDPATVPSTAPSLPARTPAPTPTTTPQTSENGSQRSDSRPADPARTSQSPLLSKTNSLNAISSGNSTADTTSEASAGKSAKSGSKETVVRLTRKQTVKDLAAEYFDQPDNSAVQLILSRNPKVRNAGEVLPAGTELVLPAQGEKEERTRESKSGTADGPQRPEGSVPSRGVKKSGRVRVQHDETLFQFALEELGRGDWATVGKIRAANPQIRDPYEILEKGQWVRLPEEAAQP